MFYGKIKGLGLIIFNSENNNPKFLLIIIGPNVDQDMTNIRSDYDGGE